MPTTNPAPIWKRKRPESLGEPVPLTPKQKAAAKAMAKAAGRKYPNLVDNIAASRMENPTMKTATKRKPTPAQLAARERFAEMARSGAFKKAGARKRTTTRKANPTDLSVAQTILAQLGGNRFIAMTGAKSFIGGPTFLGFTIPRNSSPANRVTVTYEPGRDLYSMSFIKTSRGGLDSKEVQRFDGLYADQLRPTFTQVTGMETSLGTMGRMSNPAKPTATRRVNPADEYTYSVDMEGVGKSGLFMTKAVFKTAQDAKQYARALAKSYPSRTIRVMSGGRWIKR